MIGKAVLVTLISIVPPIKSQIDAGTWQTKCINLQQQDPKNVHHPIVSLNDNVDTLLQSELLQLPVVLFYHPLIM